MTAAPCVKHSHLEKAVEPALLISSEVFTQKKHIPQLSSSSLSLSLSVSVGSFSVVLAASSDILYNIQKPFKPHQSFQ